MKNFWPKLFKSKKFKYYKLSKNIRKSNIIEQSFNFAKIIYPDLTKKKFKSNIKFIQKNLQIKKNSSVLDFGSGNGSFLFYFQKKFNLKKNYSFKFQKIY